MTERWFCLFRSSFRYEAAPNISHETIDKVKTLCGRKVADAETLESDDNDLPPELYPLQARERTATQATVAATTRDRGGAAPPRTSSG